MNYAEDRRDRKSKTELKQTIARNHDIITRSHKAWNENETKDDENNKLILIEAHRSSAQCLRDMGENLQAVFHYALAWKLTPEDAFGVGDYAQMVEMCGYPELGILALLLFRSGRLPDEYYPIFTSSSLDEDAGRDCGCGLSGCGKMFGMISPFMHIMRQCKVDEGVSSEDENNLLFEILCAIHEFWNDDDDKDVRDNCSEKIDFCIRRRPLPPLLQLLLLKLLYTSYLSGGLFLTYACEALPFISAKFHQSTRLNYQSISSGKIHKSHWAYYILMYAVLVGER